MKPTQAIVPERQTVLVVDDDPAVLASLKFSLEIEGFRVEIFKTGVELLARDSFPAHSCLVVDYRLPAMNGIDVVDALRHRGLDFPVILMTSNPPIQLLRRAEMNGLRLVEKPLLGNSLPEAIRAALDECGGKARTTAGA